MVPCPRRDGISVPDLGGLCHEIAVEPCRAFSRRRVVNCLAVRPGSVANRPSQAASFHHGRGAEAGGKAKSCDTGGDHGGISPEIENYPDVVVNRSSAVAGAGFRAGQDCRAGESREQLQRWLRIEPPAWQGPLGRVQRVGGRTNIRTVLVDVPRQPHLQILRRLRRNQMVPGRVPKQGLVALQQPAGRGEV